MKQRAEGERAGVLTEGQDLVLKSREAEEMAGGLGRPWGWSTARAEDKDEVREGDWRQKMGHV